MAIDTTIVDQSMTIPEAAARSNTMGRFNRWDTPWLNPKLIAGSIIIIAILLMGIIGPFFWDTSLAGTSRDQFYPPNGFVYEQVRARDGFVLRRIEGTAEHPLGTDRQGRDMLAVILLGAPNTFLVGVIAATAAMSVGIFLGFSSGFLGGWVDDIIRISADVTLTIPPLLVLIVAQAAFDQDIGLTGMALLIAAFGWPRPTRQLRAQVLSMRESGYVRMASLSGVSTFSIMFREMLPNLIPYIFSSFISGATGAILAAVGLETLGLGSREASTLGTTIYRAIDAAALTNNLWWWWGIPTALLALMFTGLFLINIGLDEIANPRLRKSSK